MKRVFGLALSLMTLAVFAGEPAPVTLPTAPTVQPLSAPTTEQTDMRIPTNIPLPTPVSAADETQVRALVQAWVIPVGKPMTQDQAAEQINTLQREGFSAFSAPASANAVQVWVGPEVDQDHLQQTHAALLKVTPDVGAVSAYILPTVIPAPSATQS